MNILGLQKNHNSSVALFCDYKLVYYNQEERLSKIKNDSFFPLHILNEIKKLNIKIDKVVATGYNTIDAHTIYGYMYKIGLIDSVYENTFHFYKSHHLVHAVKAMYSSNMEKALILVADGRGSTYLLDNGKQGHEIFSVYNGSIKNGFDCLYKRLQTTLEGHGAKARPEEIYGFDFVKPAITLKDFKNFDVDHRPVSGAFYSRITNHLGFKTNDEGKLMGLQSYGKPNKRIKEILSQDDLFNNKNERSDKVNFSPNLEKYPELYYHKKLGFKQIHYDIAYEAQKQFEKQMVEILDKCITNHKNIIITGGCGLNVVFNYRLRKALPKDINLYIDPLCGDEGNSIGAAITYGKYCGERNNFDSIYLGPKPKYNIEKGNDKIEDVVKHLVDKKIVGLYQGSAEAGPRALGNRSLLLDPRIKDGKDIMNKVKNREWFRPFGACILEEEADKWFDMAGLKNSPYMLYAVEALEGVKKKIPAVIHVDNTCRIQTVNEKQNPVLYNLLKQFNQKTNVPILMNTSFNLAGETLVETPEDALETFNKSDINCIYFADIERIYQ
jgi:carbamoyltransferase